MMKYIIYISLIFMALSLNAQQKSPAKTGTTNAKKSTSQKSGNKKKKNNPAVEFEKKALTDDQKVLLTKMAYDIYRSQLDSKPSLLDNQMPMIDVVMPNSITPSSAEIHASTDKMKKGLNAKVQKATTFVTVAGVPQNNAYWLTISADCKMLPYFRYVDFESKWNFVKNKSGQDIMLMNEKDQSKENKIAHNVINNNFNYNLIIDYKPGDSIPKNVQGTIKVAVPKKFEVLELKKTDLNKDLTLGKTKIKLLRLYPKSYLIKVDGDDPNLKMIVISEENKQFTNNSISHISNQQYEVFKRPLVLSEDTLMAVGARINDINETNRIKVGKVTGNGKIQKIILFRAIESESVEVKVDLHHIDVKEESTTVAPK